VGWPLGWPGAPCPSSPGPGPALTKAAFGVRQVRQGTVEFLSAGDDGTDADTGSGSCSGDDGDGGV